MCEVVSLLPGTMEILRQVREKDNGWLTDVRSASLVDPMTVNENEDLSSKDLALVKITIEFNLLQFQQLKGASVCFSDP